MEQTLENVLAACNKVTPFQIGGMCLLCENETTAWVFCIIGNMAKLIKHSDKATDPINDIRNSIEPEDLK